VCALFSTVNCLFTNHCVEHYEFFFCWKCVSDAKAVTKGVSLSTVLLIFLDNWETCLVILVSIRHLLQWAGNEGKDFFPSNPFKVLLFCFWLFFVDTWRFKQNHENQQNVQKLFICMTKLLFVEYLRLHSWKLVLFFKESRLYEMSRIELTDKVES